MASVSGSPAPVRIGNCSGFYGDRLAAMREMLTGGDLDYLTGDYLAELTMLILARDRAKSPDRGYAKTFLTQLEDCLGTALDQGVRIVANAGGLNPAGSGRRGPRAGRPAGPRRQRRPRRGRRPGGPRRRTRVRPAPLAANAYLGAWGIVDCLNAGADVVVTGRVTDASVIVGPAAAHFGWGRTDYDALAGAVAAGHVIECGAQATGGNYAFFTEVADLRHAGFPLAEIHADGSSVITKHPGTGGAGQRRHGHRPAALRDRRRALRQSRRDAAGRHHRAVRRRTRPGADQRREGRAAAADAQGVAQQRRRLPQRDDVRADRPGHRGQGRPGAPAAGEPA